ncbi:MAG: hypothetical protein QHH12_08180 [Candidatus Bathyarchaeota archaeon]|nr:hypothetical protein [Candidatus Bathyarchaeota archaeon]
MNEIVDAINGAFEALFFGTGSWLGLLLLLSICVGLLTMWKWSGILLLPVTIFLGIEYLNRDMAWHAMIIFFTSIFILFFMVKQYK